MKVFISWSGEAGRPASGKSAGAARRIGDAVIRVYDEAGNLIETREHKGDFKEWCVRGSFTDRLEPFALRTCSFQGWMVAVRMRIHKTYLMAESVPRPIVS